MNNWSTHLASMLASRSLPWRLTAAALLIGMVAGLGAYQLDSGRIFNILAPPALILILANLAIYLFKVVKFIVLAGCPDPPKLAAWLTARLPVPQQDQAVPDLPARRITASLAVVSNAFAVGLAAGVVGGIYLRGLIVEYRAGWESTLLDATAVAGLLEILLAPAAWVTGLNLPDAGQIAGLRLVDNAGGGDARLWLYLWSASVAIWVIAPRLVLAGIALAKCNSKPRQRTSKPPVASLPTLLIHYCLPGSDARADGLATIAADACPWPAQIVAKQSIAYGEEEEAAALSSDAAVAAIVLVGISSTPEPETHGVLIEQLKVHFEQVAVVLDVQPWRDEEERIKQRRAAWLALVADDIPVIALDSRQVDSGQER